MSEKKQGRRNLKLPSSLTRPTSTYLAELKRGQASSGSYWGVDFRRTGYDGIEAFETEFLVQK